MSRREHVSKTPSPLNGLFALLSTLFGGKGFGAPKIGRGVGSSKTSRRLVLSVLATALGALAFTAAPALAAPEKPEVSVEDTTSAVGTPSIEARLHGVLNPNTAGEEGTYQFLYKASKTGACEGGEVAPVSPGMSFGFEREEYYETITGLTAGTEYAVCLRVENNTKTESARSAPFTFTTATPPEKPVTKSPAASITATTATLEGTLDPLKAGEAGTYEFTYQRSSSECNREFGAPEPAGTMTGAKEQAVSVMVEHLEPNQTYTFCAVAINTAGEPTVGNLVTFKTAVSKPSVINESAEPKAEEVRLNATVNPSNEKTECHFQYGTASVSEHTVQCEQGNELEGGEQGVAVSVTGLKQNTVYHYRVVVKNATGEVKGTGIAAEEEFTTKIHPETPIDLKVEAVTASTARLSGVLNPKAAGNPGSYEFLYKDVANGAGCEGEQSSGGPALGNTPEPVKTQPELTGLIPNTTYTACLRAHNEVGEESALTAPVTFSTPPLAPNIESESSTVVDATEARLEAKIDPGNAETAYHFEYGTSAGDYTVSIPVPDGHIHAGLEGRSVSVAAVGLEASTTYHWRVVASNSLPGVVEYGADQKFTTPAAQPTGTTPGSCPNEKLREEQPYGLKLPDCRAYEMVSPLETVGNDATDPSSLIQAGQVRASEDEEKEARGEEATPAITYVSLGAFAQPAGNDYESELLSRRGPGGWSTRSISAPHEHDAYANDPFGYFGVFFTPELTEGLTDAVADLTSAPEAAPEGLRELYLANFENPDEPISYRLVSHLPLSEEEYAEPYKLEPAVFPLGASRDLSHVVFTTENHTTIGPLREWVAGRVVSVGVSNEGQVWTGASVGNSAQGGLEGGSVNVWRAVSEDGSRVIFNYLRELYARVNVGATVEPEPAREQSALNAQKECSEPAKACTVKLSAGEATYWGASTEDTKVFYTENEKLFAFDFERYEEAIENNKPEAQALEAAREDIAGEGLAHENAGVQGVVQVSEDGSYVYFVADGALESPATPQTCTVPGGAGEGCNLYVEHYGHGKWTTTFIATLSPNDAADWLIGGVYEGPGGDTAVLAPGAAGGAHLAFVSEQSLTGYDNEQAGHGECEGGEGGGHYETGRCREVFLYDAETGAPPVCASCDPTGARPVGSSSLATGAYYGGETGASNYRPRDLLADGSLFFDSKDALVPHASDGRQNVYEYEDGHVYPISNVSGGQESFFLDASPDGQDVFFGSADQLLPEDTGDNIAVWDARTDGGFPVNVGSAACTTAEACRAPSPPTPGIYGPPASATFSGPGNLAPPPPAVVKPAVKPKTLTRAQKLANALKVCAKDKRKAKRAKCRELAKRKYGTTKAKKPSHNGRAH